jgi:vitamin B12 transporter
LTLGPLLRLLILLAGIQSVASGRAMGGPSAPAGEEPARGSVAQAAGGLAAARSDTGFVVAGGDTIWLLPPLEVVGSRVPAGVAARTRAVSVLDDQALARLDGLSTSAPLFQVPGVVPARRGPYDLQSDLSIRGASFEQVLVLLDGIEIGDPQTGHHHWNLPLAPQDVSRLEILRGHGSALYGAGAFGGVVQVVSRRPATHPSAELALGGGGQSTWTARGNVSLPLAGGEQAPRLRLSAAGFRTAGDRPDRDGGRWTATGRLVLPAGAAVGEGGDLFFGWARREFGALDFYSPAPSWERTTTGFATARWRLRTGARLVLEPRLHYRRHEDRFVLYRDEPQRYTNEHRTDRGGLELRLLLAPLGGWSLAASTEAVYEDLHSSGIRLGLPAAALGEHDRRRLSAALELNRRSGPLHGQLGVRLDARSGFLPELSTSAAAAWELARLGLVRCSAGTVGRVPTFTELYYEDPFNQGDPHLAPEHGWSWDAGWELRPGALSLSWTAFERRERDLIEWARPVAESGSIWRVLNVARGRTRGQEAAVAYRWPRGHTLQAAFTSIDRWTRLAEGYEGKYALVHPREQLALAGTIVLGRGLEVSASARYTERTTGSPAHQAAFVLGGVLGWRAGPWRWILEGSNLLDRTYEEVPGVVMPGRLLTASLERDMWF